MGGRRPVSLPKMLYMTLTVPGMSKPPSRYDVTVRVARDDGHPSGPAAFAVAVAVAASMNVRVLSAHAAEEIICIVGVAAPERPSAVAVALAVVAAVVRRLEEHRLPELLVAAVACDPEVSMPRPAASRAGSHRHGVQLTCALPGHSW